MAARWTCRQAPRHGRAGLCCSGRWRAWRCCCICFGDWWSCWRPRLRKLLYTTMALCQAANLLLFALESAPGLGLPPGPGQLEPGLRLALDAATGAAIAHALAFRTAAPAPQANGKWPVPPAAACGRCWPDGRCSPPGLVVAQGLSWPLPGVGGGRGAPIPSRWSPIPMRPVMRRLGVIATGTFMLVTAAVAMGTHCRACFAHRGGGRGDVLDPVPGLAAVAGRRSWRAASRCCASLRCWPASAPWPASVDLLFVSVFSLGPSPRWRWRCSSHWPSTPARASHPGPHAGPQPADHRTHLRAAVPRRARGAGRAPRYPAARRDCWRFIRTAGDAPPADRVRHRAVSMGGGAALVVPAARPRRPTPRRPGAGLRFAQRGAAPLHPGRRAPGRPRGDLLRRAVAYDQAVERGRHEERQRIAQDLHDDIGARS
jgi:hypothetical protein